MSGVIKIEILETIDELRQLLQSSETKEVKERVQALYWLKSGQVKTTKAIASLIGKHRVTVSRWLSSYKAQGINALLTKGKSSGRKKKHSPSVEASLRQELIDEQGFSSYKEIQMHLIQLDNGRWHIWSKLDVPDNVILIFQPPYCPQVNPIERLS